LLAADAWRLQDAFEQLLRDKSGVVPFTVVANAEIKNVDIFITIARVDVKEEDRLAEQITH
jgi:hypothetical protein